MEMKSSGDKELKSETLLLRDLKNDALGLYSPTFNSICLTEKLLKEAHGDDSPEQNATAWGTIVHEKTHWHQYHATPWGYYQTSLLSTYVSLTEFLFKRYYELEGKLVKPLARFLEGGTHRKNDSVLNDIINDHIASLESLKLVFRGTFDEKLSNLSEVFDRLSRFMLDSEESMDECRDLRPFGAATFILDDEQRRRVFPEEIRFEAILEAWAKIVEKIACVRAGLLPNASAVEESEALFGSLYGELIEYFAGRIGAVAIGPSVLYSLVAVCAASLQSPAHPGFRRHWPRLQSWSDVMPTGRLVRLLDNFDAVGLISVSQTEDRARAIEEALDEYVEALCGRNGWPGPRALADEAIRNIDAGHCRETAFSSHYRTACEFVRRSPSFAVLGPLHSHWDGFEREIRGIPLFLNPIRTKHYNEILKSPEMSSAAHAEIMTGVRLNFCNEIMFEESFNNYEVATVDEKGIYVPSAEEKQVLQTLYIDPLFEHLRGRLGIDSGRIFIVPFDVRRVRGTSSEHRVLIKSSVAKRWAGKGLEIFPRAHPKKGEIWRFVLK